MHLALDASSLSGVAAEVLMVLMHHAWLIVTPAFYIMYICTLHTTHYTLLLYCYTLPICTDDAYRMMHETLEMCTHGSVHVARCRPASRTVPLYSPSAMQA